MPHLHHIHHLHQIYLMSDVFNIYLSCQIIQFLQTWKVSKSLFFPALIYLLLSEYFTKLLTWYFLTVMCGHLTYLQDSASLFALSSTRSPACLTISCTLLRQLPSNLLGNKFGIVASSSFSEYSGILTPSETLRLSCSESFLLLGWESLPGVNHIGKWNVAKTRVSCNCVS